MNDGSPRSGDSRDSSPNVQLSARPSLTGDVLIVDDMATIRMTLARHVRHLGHRVSLAEDGRRAVELLAAQSFDLVLLDIMMPDMDGYAVLEHIKADPHTHEIPVLMISGLDELQSVVRCIKHGADDYLTKPFQLTLLEARIQACLQKKHLWSELKDRYQQLQKLERLRDSLTHMIVHDMRTPLTSLLTGIQTVEAAGVLNELQRECLEMSIAGGQVLLAMINDLLDISKMEDGSMHLEYSRIDPAVLVEHSIQQVAPLGANCGLNVIPVVDEHLPELVGDADKIRRVLVNLLGNAIKFTPDGGTITLRAQYETESKHTLFSVHDTGEGIPQEAFDRIFEKFGQVETRKAGRKMSSGLGLTFCKMAVEAHGGTIWVQSVLGRGSTFRFTIPAANDPSLVSP
ncbi:MAG: hybrid sensor histidine kinase/response regulator [Chthonomonadales bacterium]